MFQFVNFDFHDVASDWIRSYSQRVGSIERAQPESAAVDFGDSRDGSVRHRGGGGGDLVVGTSMRTGESHRTRLRALDDGGRGSWHYYGLVFGGTLAYDALLRDFKGPVQHLRERASPPLDFNAVGASEGLGTSAGRWTDARMRFRHKRLEEVFRDRH